MKEVVEIFSVTLEIQWYLNAFRDDTHKIFCYVDVKYYMLENQVKIWKCDHFKKKHLKAEFTAKVLGKK